MYLRRDESTRTVRAPAKLNIYLDVLGRRADGFHELETLIVPVRWWDSVTLTPKPPAANGEAGELSLRVRSYLSARDTPQTLPPADHDNLVMRALKLLRERSGCAAGARVELVKRIPMAAGLGGGSSDAAAVLSAANRAWGLGWDRDRLTEVGAEIGSDVPFFLGGGAAICRGRGEGVESLPGILPLDFVIVKPPAGLATAEVYRAYDAIGTREPPARGNRLNELALALRVRRYGELGRLMMNRLEVAAATLSPWVERVRSVFERLGCVGHQLSGSGSSYFGVCRHAQEARRLAAVLRTRQLGLVCATRSC